MFNRLYHQRKTNYLIIKIQDSGLRSACSVLPDTNTSIVIIFHAPYHVFVEVVRMRQLMILIKKIDKQ